MLHHKVRQRRLALLKARSANEEDYSLEANQYIPLVSQGEPVTSDVKPFRKDQIETVAEVLTEIPENVKKELQKRKKLNELRKASGQADGDSTCFIEVIQEDIESDNAFSNPDYRVHEDVDFPTSSPEHLTYTENWFADGSPNESNSYDQKKASSRQTLSPIKPMGEYSGSSGATSRSFMYEREEKVAVVDIPSLQSDTATETSVKSKPRSRRRNIIRKKDISSPSTLATSPSNSVREVTEEEAFNFFTRVWSEDDVTQSLPHSESKNNKGIPEIVITDGVDDDDSVFLKTDYFESDSDGFITQEVKPEYISDDEKTETENVIYFFPTITKVPAELKLPEGTTAPSSNEKKIIPNVPFWNINILENRLVKQKEFHWFDEDGSVKMLPSSTNGIPTHCLLPDNQQAKMQKEVMYVKADVPTSCHQHLKKKNSNTLYQLDLDVSSISFTHHPLFSKEHVLASTLIQMCKKYIACTENNVITALKQKIKALRFALRQPPLVNRADMSPARKTRYKIYKNEIRQTRRLCDTTEAEQSCLLQKIMNCWDELKTLRENQGYINTTIKVEIHEEATDESVEKEEWDKELRHELEDEKEEFDFQYESSLKDYNHTLLLWKEWHKARKQALKRQEKRETSGQNEEETSPKIVMESTDLEDENLLSEPEKSKPKAPSKFDTKKVVNQLMENASKLRRKPGEPKVFVKLEEYALTITPTDQCPKEEIQRRNDVSKTKLHFKIMYNEKKVSETNLRSLTQDFNAFWGQIFKLHIVHYPQSFKLEVYESYKSRRITLAEAYIPIPDITQTSLTAQLVDHQFSSDLVVPSVQNAIGSGIQYFFANGEQTWLLTNGVVKCSLAWGVGENDSVLAPPKIEENISLLRKQKISSPLGKLFSEYATSLSKLRERIRKLQLDVYDPSNADLLETIYEYGLDKNEMKAEETVGYFRLEPFEDLLNFVPVEEINNNPRFRLLQLRNQDASEFKNLQMIPADSKNLSHELIELLQKKSVEDEQKVECKAQKDQAHQLRQKVRNEVAKRFYVSQHQRTLEDIVYEEKIPNIGTLGFGLLKLLKRKRPLYPVRKERKKVTGQAVANSEVKIMVSVLHAMNVPVRTDVDPLMDKMRRRASVHTDPDAGFESLVRPFVEVMFQRVAMKTTVAEGPHPTWNQELCLPFRAVDDNFSPQNLERVKDVIYFNLFDEVTVDLLEDASDRESVVHQRLERRWLGNLKIPFTTLYLNSKIEGTFCLNAPLVQLGYESEQRPWLTGDAQDAARNTHLSLFITIEPCLQLPEVFREKYDTGEPDRIIHEVERWHQTVVSRFPERLIKLMTVDLRGKWTFVSRFLHPISPPDELLTAGKDSLQTLEMLARFVSLIPTVSDSVIYPGLCDIWSTCDQFLQMLTGDQEEHAITLCNFFLYLEKKAMLLLGSGIPEGPTSYVLTWEESGEVWAWNASSGSHFNVQDSYSPLQRVGCLIGPDNIWANIQKSDHPSRIHFDLTKASDWKPFFNKTFPNPGLKSVQPENLSFTTTDPDFVQKLQDKLKQSLQENIMKWRRKHCTSWNNYCNQVLFKILTRLERNAGRTASIDSLQELEQILSSHKLSGFPLTMPYTDIDAVIETVFSTGVHLTEGKNVEFSLAVYVHPYPCSVLAIWVYVAVLVSRRGVEND